MALVNRNEGTNTNKKNKNTGSNKKYTTAEATAIINGIMSGNLVPTTTPNYGAGLLSKDPVGQTAQNIINTGKTTNASPVQTNKTTNPVPTTTKTQTSSSSSSNTTTTKKPSSGSGTSSTVNISGGTSVRPSENPTYDYSLDGVRQQKPKMWTGQELADMYGFVFGEDQIKEILNEATNAKFNEYDAQMRRIRDNSLTDYSAAHNQYLNSFRNAKQNALQTGATKGSTLAQELGILLGSQATEGANQTQYQQSLADIANQRGTQLASDGYTAMMTQNELASTLGNLASQYYGYDVQDNVGYLSYLGQQGANAANMALANAQKQSAAASDTYYQALLQQAKNDQGNSTDVVSNLMKSGYDIGTATLLALRPDLYESLAKSQTTNTTNTGNTGAVVGAGNSGSGRNTTSAVNTYMNYFPGVVNDPAGVSAYYKWMNNR